MSHIPFYSVLTEEFEINYLYYIIFQMSDKISLTICTMFKIKNIGVTELFRLRKAQFQLQFLILKIVSAVWIVEYHWNTLLGMLRQIAPLQEKLKNIEIKEFAAHPDDKQILEQGSSHKEQSLYSWEERKWGIVFLVTGGSTIKGALERNNRLKLKSQNSKLF